ncbi:MAG: DUF4845 domain-containing protein [Zoogloea sp.]|nr:DUF4845 domain-containing protein [Zoogloea sp.]MCA0188587.1 DUF4845 domain-containing protein [Pseudomonadota bacterium]
MTRKSQAGLSLIGTMFVGVVLAAVVLLGLKLIPVFSEFFGVKRAIAAVAAEADPQTATVPQLRMAFSKRAMVDEVTSVSATDLDITKENGQIVISVEYSRKVPLFSGVSLLFDLSASSAGSAVK